MQKSGVIDTENRRKFTDFLNILQQPTYSAFAYGKASAFGVVEVPKKVSKIFFQAQFFFSKLVGCLG